MYSELQTIIEQIDISQLDIRQLDKSLKSKNLQLIEAVKQVIDLLDKGELRIAQQLDIRQLDNNLTSNNLKSNYVVNEWLKKAILLYFSILVNCPQSTVLSPQSLVNSKKNKITKDFRLNTNYWLEYNDKIPLKKNYNELGIRVIPGAIARYGSFIAKGVIMMPSFVNIGAYVDSGTMVDTWVTVGSCAQIGKNVHLSGGVGIGGVLEPLQAAPVIIEDNCFIGSRCIIVEGVIIEKESVLGANVVITKSTKIIDVSLKEPKEYYGYVPARSVVIPGSYIKSFPAGNYNVPCALIIGKRKQSTDLKTSLNDALRDYKIN